MCTYCGCDQFEVVGRFMQEHIEIINHTGILRESLDGGDTSTAADTLAAALHPHTAAEETGLFAVMRRDPTFTDHIDSLCAEHEQLDALLARIRAGEHELFAEFERLLRDHIDREDNGLFPASAIHLDGPAWTEVDELTPPATGG